MTTDPAADALRGRFRRQVDALHAEGYMTFDEAAAELGVARYTAQRMVADGRLRVEWVDDRGWRCGPSGSPLCPAAASPQRSGGARTASCP
ncbi:helix-turn-helix domain-containing protein [Mycolicibacterium holsaticum]|uniref:Helix-turn-helix domain-containing protein n=1 Tax=Mycolicibacterium holsaticum TaxID=152142 RepID=A0A1E3S0A1_9MYCO|nr:helix-turn-helix domain-containing protein [Mycolicibacterium holsaticum]ODQ95539.1 hypothetical protein BHQ17_04445 [Mycolicibacterium holsaticum]